MLGFDPEFETSALRLLVAASSAALLVLVCAFAFGTGRTRSVARTSVIFVGAVLGATLAWAFLNAAAVRDQSAERRALEMRAAELNLRALAPGSPLACLDALVGEGVEAACEKAIFATPAAVASATSYIAARIALLSDMASYAKQGGTTIDSALLPLRQSLETDRFGFVAHALAVRDGCTSQNCKALALLHDPSHVRANLSGETLDRYLDHYLTAWAATPELPVADAGLSQPSAGQSGPPGPRKMVNIDFPTASSIPAVSIMNAEPKTPTQAGASDAKGQPAGTPGRSRKQAGKSGAPAAPAPAGEPAAAVDPVWAPSAVAPAVTQAPAAPAPSAANAGSPGTGPVQLNPFSPQPGASAGAAARTQ